MEAFFEFLWSASAILLVILVLLHSPKGDGLAAISGQAQLFASPKSAEQNLNRLTWTVATLFLSSVWCWEQAGSPQAQGNK
jgi:preprotein translocase subunit SecG